MYIIKNKVTGRIHREPARARRGYGSSEYASERAAKAGITRTLKYYQKAIDQVLEVRAEGKADYYAPMYNAYRDATDPALGRTYCDQAETYEVMTREEYLEKSHTTDY